MAMKRKLEDFGELWPAEEQILAEIDSGEDIELHDGLPPKTPSEKYDVRAEFIRYLALGGCKACGLHEKGLRIVGARIIGVLDLEGGDLPRDLGLFACPFESELVFLSAKLQSLFLNHSLLPEGLSADRLEAKGNVVLDGVEAHGAVRLLGAKLGGDLDCDGVTFNAAKDGAGKPTGFAFGADGLEAKGSLLLRDVEAHGEVRLLGAKLGGDLECSGATFSAAKDGEGKTTGAAFGADRLEAKGSFFLRDVEAHGEVRLLGAKLGGNLDCEGATFNAAREDAGKSAGVAFGADMLEAKGSFFLRGGARISGRISLGLVEIHRELMMAADI
ncbi:MAG: hypothetical protein COB08_009315 [Rhodobacteraceae bacterium]|nr:hypothetical protein [Paracoccaceae bacterium]